MAVGAGIDQGLGQFSTTVFKLARNPGLGRSGINGRNGRTNGGGNGFDGGMEDWMVGRNGFGREKRGPEELEGRDGKIPDRTEVLESQRSGEIGRGLDWGNPLATRWGWRTGRGERNCP